MPFSILQILIFLFFPAVIIRMTANVRLFKWLGPIILSYATGLMLANMPYLPLNAGISNTTVQITIPLAIALLLFQTDFMGWLQFAGQAIGSFCLAIIAVCISAFAAYFLFTGFSEHPADLAGMMIGVYTGGTPNLSAIGLSLGVKEETFILINAADLAFGGLYFFLLLTIAPAIFRKLLRPFPKMDPHHVRKQGVYRADSSYFNSKNTLLNYLLPFLGAMIIVALSIGISYLIMNEIKEVVVILSVTTLGIAASFFKTIRTMEKNYWVGEYLLMIFCIAIGSLASFENLVSAGSSIIVYVAFVMTMAIALHLVFAYIFRIDADTFIITSVAGIYGPALVPPVAKILNNEDILVSGLTTGLVGYTVANYLGIFFAYLLQ